MFVNQRELASGDAAILTAEALNSFFKSLADYRYAPGDLHSTARPGRRRRIAPTPWRRAIDPHPLPPAHTSHPLTAQGPR
jgi:hypothetical protein